MPSESDFRIRIDSLENQLVRANPALRLYKQEFGDGVYGRIWGIADSKAMSSTDKDAMSMRLEVHVVID